MLTRARRSAHDARHIHGKLLETLARRLYGDSPRAFEASQTGTFDVEGLSVNVELEPDSEMLCMRCSAPELATSEALMRKLLEYDLAGRRDEIVFGIHPGTGQVGASRRIGIGFVMEAEEAGIMLLESLVNAVRRVCGGAR